ncbi:MAG: hypothetical protein FWD05_10885 [Oscillospiraceae bacterium]|nr:hypothetical protein [Oscillospiraceae bacterium]
MEFFYEHYNVNSDGLTYRGLLSGTSPTEVIKQVGWDLLAKEYGGEVIVKRGNSEIYLYLNNIGRLDQLMKRTSGR